MSVLAPYLKQRFFDSNGLPLAGGKLETFIAGTSTPLATYTDQSGTAANTNPIILDANGECDMWLNELSYKFVLKNSLDVVQWTVDNVTPQFNQVLTNAMLIQNLGLAFTVGGNSMTASLKTAAGLDPSVASPVKVAFRSSNLASGVISLVSITSALSTVISAGSTGGHYNNVSQPFYWYLINNAGVAELAWSKTLFDENGLISTTAEGGAGAADNAQAMYSTVARLGVAFRLIAQTFDTQAVAGTYTTVPTSINVGSFGKFKTITAWQDCTVSGTWLTNTAYTAKKRRVGENMEYDIKIATSGLVAATNLLINIDETIDTAKLTNPTLTQTKIGQGVAQDSATNFYLAGVYYYAANAVALYVHGSAATYVGLAAITNLVPFTFNAADTINVQFSVPIVG